MSDNRGVTERTQLNDCNEPSSCLYDYFAIYNDYNFDSPPNDLLGAALRYIYLNPVPSEVWRFLDATIMLEGAGLPATYFEDLTHVSAAPPKRNRYSELDVLYPLNSGRPGGKVHATASGVASACHPHQLSRDISARLLNSTNDWENVIASSLILLPLTSPMGGPALAQLLLADSEFWLLPYVDATKRLKAIHTFIRVTKTAPLLSNGTFALTPLTNDQSTEFYGVDSLAGPSEKLKLDTFDEILMRQVPASFPAVPVFSSDPNSSQRFHLSGDVRQRLHERAVLRTVRETLDEPIAQIPTLSEWYQARMGWAAAGGAPGAKVTWGDGTKSRVNKRAALLAISEEDFNRIISQPEFAILYSKASTKFEKGKKRAIWNTAIEHYLAQAYMLDALEKNATSRPGPFDGDSPVSWNAGTHSSNERIQAQLYRLYQLSEYHGLMWDYSDFNINHRQDDTVVLYTTFTQRLIENLSDSCPHRRQVINDLTRCCEWVNQAKLHTYLDANDPLHPYIAEVVRSLQSGERATSFTNTYSSRTYIHMAQIYIEEHLSEPPVHIGGASLLGDDVFMSTHSITAAQLLCCVLNTLGFAGQLFKITSDYGPRGEFLRLSYDGELHCVRGYPLRTSMGLISGEFFMESIFDPDARAVAFAEAWVKANRRGATIPKAFLNYLITRNCAVVFTTPAGVKLRIVSEPERALAPALFGGEGVSSTPIAFDLNACASYRGWINRLPKPKFIPPQKAYTQMLRSVNTSDLDFVRRLPTEYREKLFKHATDITAASALTGAYAASDLRHAIDSYAKALLAFRKNSQRHLYMWQPYTISPSDTCNLLDALKDAFSFYEALNRVAPLEAKTPRFALVIPSGHGKTTLKEAHPDLFTDHDDLEIMGAIDPWLESKQWSRANLHHRISARRAKASTVLLTWGPDTVPRSFTILAMSSVNTSPTRGVPENLAHLASAYPDQLSVFPTYADQDSVITRLSRQYLNAHYSKISRSQPAAAFITNTFSRKVRRPPASQENYRAKPAKRTHPTHHYGAIALLTIPAGFSLLEVMLRYISMLPSHTFIGDAGRLVCFLRNLLALPGSDPLHQRLGYISSHHATIASGMLNFLLDGSAESAPLRAEYVHGSLTFIPPVQPLVSPDVIVLARDTTLQYIEQKKWALFSTTPGLLIAAVHALEEETTRLFYDVLSPTYLNDFIVFE